MVDWVVNFGLRYWSTDPRKRLITPTVHWLYAFCSWMLHELHCNEKQMLLDQSGQYTNFNWKPKKICMKFLIMINFNWACWNIYLRKRGPPPSPYKIKPWREYSGRRGGPIFNIVYINTLWHRMAQTGLHDEKQKM